MTLTGALPHTTEQPDIAPWRMVSAFDVPGDYLMALDEVLLESVIVGGTPVVRFYTWRPAALSLGVNR